MRLIDADKLREDWVNHLHIPNPDSWFAVEQEITSDCIAGFIQSIDEQPTVEPIRHGHWVEKEQCKGFHTYCCSKCGHGEIDTTNHCSNCGAKMDEGIEG